MIYIQAAMTIASAVVSQLLRRFYDVCDFYKPPTKLS